MKEPAHILFTIPNFISAGSGEVLLDIVKTLDRKRFKPSICVLKRGGKLYHEIEEMGIPLMQAEFTVKAKPRLLLPFRLLKAARHFKQYRYDLWHSFHYSDDYTEPMIARLSGAKSWVYTKKNMSWGSRAWKVRSTLANRIAAQNQFMIKEYLNSYREKVEHIPFGIDPKKFFAKPKSKTLRQSLKLSSHDVMLGHVANFIRVKNHGLLIRTLSLCHESVHLVCAGQLLDEDYVQEMKDLAHDLGVADRFHILGHVKDVPHFLNSIDMFVYSSYQEGGPVALLEAMACQLPCIAMENEGIREILENEQTGLIVKRNDAVGFTDMIEMLMKDPERKEKLAQRGYEHVIKNYTIEKEVYDYQRFYEKAIRNSQEQ